jgi:hypothetical protein
MDDELNSIVCMKALNYNIYPPTKLFASIKYIFILFLSLIYTIAYAQYDAKIDGIYYKFNKDKMTASVVCEEVREGGMIKDNTNSYSGDVVIPAKVSYEGINYNVVGIGSLAFYYSPNLTSVSMPNSITSMGSNVFLGCTNLATVSLSNGLSRIPDDTFTGCNNIVKVITQGPPIEISNKVFKDISSEAVLIVPPGERDNYLKYGWDKYFKEVNEATLGKNDIFTIYGINFSIVSTEERTVNIAKGEYGKLLEIPTKVTYPDIEWDVVGINKGAFDECDNLAAIIWNPDVVFTEVVSNPNLLLYVKNASYAPAEINNVIVDGFADNITLTDADSWNNFYCPQEFKAKKISYTHHYKMETGFGESKGWETIALPFNVQKFTHQDRGEMVPFTIWNNEEDKKPFWLKEFGNSGWKNASYIKAYTPYIISMPNHEKYKADYKLNGNVTFSAEMAKVGVTENLLTSSYNGKTFVPNFSLQTDNSYYALNVNNDYIVYNGNKPRGSMFFIGLRDIHPFEAYMTTTSGARSIAIADDLMTTDIRDIMEMYDEEKDVRVYNLKGQLIKTEEGKTLEQVKKTLPSGVYIINGQKLIIK